MIFKNQLQSLAKLRQYKGGDLKDWMITEFRQNMLAIESAIKNLSIPPNYMRANFSPLTAVHGATTFFVFSNEPVSTNGNKSGSGGYICKKTAEHILRINLLNVIMTGSKTVSLEIYKNGRAFTSGVIMQTNSTSTFTVPFYWEFPVDLVADDVLTVGILNSGSNTSDVTIGYGLLEIKQTTQG